MGNANRRLMPTHAHSPLMRVFGMLAREILQLRDVI